MDLRSLRYFVAAVENGSITAASEACFVAQPSITHAVAQLEQEFETTFLIRSRKGVTCTQAGEQFYQKAKGLLAHADMIKQSMDTPSQAPMTLFVCPTIHFDTLKHCMRLLQEKYPDTVWRLVSEDKQVQCSLVGQVAGEALEASEKVIHLFSEDYFLLVNRQHPLLQRLKIKERLTLKDLVEYPWIERSHCQFKSGFYQILQQAGVFDDVLFSAQVNNDDRALSLVAGSVGITFAPYSPDSGCSKKSELVAIPLSKIEGAGTLNRDLLLLVHK